MPSRSFGEVLSAIGEVVRQRERWTRSGLGAAYQLATAAFPAPALISAVIAHYWMSLASKRGISLTAGTPLALSVARLLLLASEELPADQVQSIVAPMRVRIAALVNDDKVVGPQVEALSSAPPSAAVLEALRRPFVAAQVLEYTTAHSFFVRLCEVPASHHSFLSSPADSAHFVDQHRRHPLGARLHHSAGRVAAPRRL